MLVIDSQVHAYDRNHPGRPWKGRSHGPAPDSATGEDIVAMMDRNGVQGSILVSTFSFYRYDASYVLEACAKHPGRFAAIKPVDASAPDIIDIITEWAATKHAIGIRIILDENVSAFPPKESLSRTLSAAARVSLPVNLLCWGNLEYAAALISEHPNTRIVVDHLGLRQPPKPPRPTAPWDEVPKVLALARYDNVAVKISGACTLSHCAYPFDDIWPPILKIIDAFGLDRCMWGTDWTRAIALLSYEQAVHAFLSTDRLSHADKAKLMGETLTTIYGWSPARRSAPIIDRVSPDGRPRRNAKDD